jgi:transposase-like protein
LHSNLLRGGLYAAGLSTRDIRSHLEEVDGLRVSADLISRVTDAVLEEVSDWRNCALEPVYAIVFLDALRVKIRDAESRRVKNKAVYVPWAARRTASVRFWACGSRPMKVPSSGLRS